MTDHRPRTDRVAVALAFDTTYAAPAAAVVRSCLLCHDGDEMRFELVHDASVSDHQLRLLEGMCVDAGADVRFHRIDDDLVRGLPRIDRFGSIVWSRLFLPEILGDASRVLYLDCDVLVLGRLDPVWQLDLGPSLIAAVANVVEPGVRPHVARLGVDYPGGYFNSGVILFQLDHMRREGSTEQLVAFARDRAEMLLWPDQDTLNAVFNERWHQLHPRWNSQNSLWSWRDWAIDVFGEDDVDAAVAHPSIRHFEGPSVAKPWHFLSLVPHRDAYREVLAQTPWADEPLHDHTMSTRLIARLPERWRLETYSRLLAARAKLAARSARR